MILSSPEAKERSNAMKATRKYSSDPNSAIFCLVTECNRARLAWLAFRIKTSPHIKERPLFAAQSWTGKLWGSFCYDIGRCWCVNNFRFPRSPEMRLLPKDWARWISVTCFPIFFALWLFQLTYVLFYFSIFQQIVNESHQSIVLSDTFYNGVF